MQSLQFFSLVSKSEHNSNALPLQLQRRNVTLKKVARRPTSGCDYCLCWLCFGLKKTIIFRNPLPGVKVTAHGTSQYGTGSLAECIPRAATRKMLLRWHTNCHSKLSLALIVLLLEAVALMLCGGGAFLPLVSHIFWHFLPVCSHSHQEN